MKFVRVGSVALLIGSLTLLSGCRYKCWLQDVFYQGEKFRTQVNTARQYLRSEHIYDQMNTLAHFDALWLSDAVRSAYASVHACKHGLSTERCQAFSRRQKEENKHYISFYLLAAVRGCSSHLLNDKDAEWSLYLNIGGAKYRPAEIKLVDLPPEYVMFFGKTYTRFKTAYLVKFDAQTVSGTQIFSSPSARSMQLCFARADREACMTWCFDSKGCLMYTDIKTHPNVLAYDLPECCLPGVTYDDSDCNRC